MTTRLNEKYPVSKFSVNQLKDREQRLKTDHNIVKTILCKSGFGWDPEIKMATAIDEKWRELSEQQQKWRNRQFPYYDDLYDIYDGKIAEVKRCRRTSDLLPETANVHSSSQEDSLDETEQFFGIGSNDVTNHTTDFGFGYEDAMNTNGADGTYITPTDIPESSHAPNSIPEDHAHGKSAPRGNNQQARSTEKGPEKIRSKKNKDLVLENLVALRKEELESYNELKEKQIESYKQVKLAQLEKNDPNNDPYCMSRCISKLTELGFLSAPDMMKAINYLKKDRLNGEIFMSLDIYGVLVEFIKEAISQV